MFYKNVKIIEQCIKAASLKIVCVFDTVVNCIIHFVPKFYDDDHGVCVSWHSCFADYCQILVDYAVSDPSAVWEESFEICVVKKSAIFRTRHFVSNFRKQFLYVKTKCFFCKEWDTGFSGLGHNQNCTYFELYGILYIYITHESRKPICCLLSILT